MVPNQTHTSLTVFPSAFTMLTPRQRANVYPSAKARNDAAVAAAAATAAEAQGHVRAEWEYFANVIDLSRRVI